MRSGVAWFFMLLGIWTSVVAGIQEYRGVAAYMLRDEIEPTIYRKNKNPRMFRNVLIWEWSTAAGFFTVGILTWSVTKRQDSLDILSPEFKGQALADDKEPRIQTK